MYSQKMRNGSGYISVCIVISVMTGASELLSESEIIFPEIAALATGMLAVPKQSWRADRKRMIVMIAAAAVAGTLLEKVSAAASLPVWGAVAVAYAAGQLLFFASKTDFVPVISAAAMPVILRTDSWIYPISAVSMTVFVSLMQKSLERAGLREEKKFTPLPPADAEDMAKAAVRILCVAAVAAVAAAAGYRFCIAPPLLVVFTEMMRKKFADPGERKKHGIRTVALIFLCAFAGAASREILTEKAGLPLTLSALSAIVLVMIFMALFRLRFPPAAALAVLPMIIAEDQLMSYPFQVCAGAAVFTAAAFLLNGIFVKITDRRSETS